MCKALNPVRHCFDYVKNFFRSDGCQAKNPDSFKGTLGTVCLVLVEGLPHDSANQNARPSTLPRQTKGEKRYPATLLAQGPAR